MSRRNKTCQCERENHSVTRDVLGMLVTGVCIFVGITSVMPPIALAEQWGPLLTTTWDQGSPFNSQCPLKSSDGPSRCWVGCVATATSQVVNYWTYPPKISFGSTDSYSSGGDVGTIAIDADATGRGFPTFDQLNRALGAIAYDQSTDEESFLCFGIGVKLRMAYGEQGSGAFQESIPGVLKDQLSYGSAELAYWADGAWQSKRDKMIENIKNGWPVQIGICQSGQPGGHSVVVDGYDDSNGKFHVNMGWGGDADGWYDLPNIGSYDKIDAVVYDIYPFQGWHQYGANEKNTFYAIYSAPTVDAVKDKWKVTCTNKLQFTGLVVAAGNRVFATASTTDGGDGNPSYIYVYDQYGNLLQKKQFPSSDDDGVTAPVASLDGNYLYVGSGKGNLYRIDAYDITISSLGNPGEGKEFIRDPKIDDNGNVYLQTFDKYYCISPSGTMRWSFPHPLGQDFRLAQGCVIDSARDHVYIPYVDTSASKQYLAVVHIPTGNVYNEKRVWDLPNAYRYSGTPSLLSTGDIVIGADRSLYILSKDDLSTKGFRNWANGTTFQHFTPAIGKDDTIYIPQYVNSTTVQLCALNPDATLSTKWSKSITVGSDYDYIQQPYVASNNIVVFGCLVKNTAGGDTFRLLGVRDKGNTYDSMWDFDYGSTPGLLAFGPGQTIYRIGGKVLSCITDGERGDPEGGGMAFTDNRPPNSASNSNPANGAQGLGSDVSLTWQCTHPEGHALKYSVFIRGDGEAGTMIPVAKDIATTSHTLTGLAKGTRYSWKVIATDGQAVSEGPTWTFQTLAPPVYALTVNSGSGGGQYEAGHVQTISADPAPAGQRFDRWTGDTQYMANVSVASTTVTMPTASVTVSATYVPYLPSCNLTASVVGGHGSVSPTTGTYTYGQKVALTATPDPGYVVKSWSGTDNDTSTTTTNTVTMNGNKTVAVQFLPTAATVSVSMAASADPVKAKDQVAYTITYSNAGQSAASNTMITEALPAGVTFLSASGGGAYNTWTRTITWNIGALAGQATGQTVSFVVAVDDSMADGGPLRHNQLTIRGDGVSPVTATTLTTTVSDTKPPQVSGCTPAANAELVSRDGIIRLHVTDAGSGVDYRKVAIIAGEKYVYDGTHEISDGVFDGAAAGLGGAGVCRRTGTPADYEFTFTPAAGCFDYSEKVEVAVQAADNAGNWRPDGLTVAEYSFTTETRTFGKNAKVNSDTAKVSHDHPQTAIDVSVGNIWVVWEQEIGGGDTDIYIGKLAPGGTAFGTSTVVYQGPGIQSHPVIAVDRNNRLYVAWQSQAANGNWDVYVSRSLGGVSWSTPVVVNVGDPQNTSNQKSPSIAIAGGESDTIYVAYEDDRAANWDIWLAVSTDGAAWTETRITTDPAAQTQPVVCVYRSTGSTWVVWTDARNAASAGTDIYAGFAYSNTPRVTSPAASSTSAENSAAAACFSSDNVALLWVVEDGSVASVRWAHEECGGPAPSNSIADEPGGRQVAPSITANAKGRAFAAWQDSRSARNNSDTDIYFTEGHPYRGFGTNILVNDDPGTSAQSSPAVGVDRDGAPYVVWVDERDGNKDIYYAGTTSIGYPLPTAVVIRDTTTVVRVTINANLLVEIPQLPNGTRADEITIREVSNPPRMPSGTNEVGLKYEFGPTGSQFTTPVTIRIPLTQDTGYESYRVYRYDQSDLTSPLFPWTESGIHNPARKVAGASGTYLEVQVDHFSIYGAVGVSTPATPPDTGGGGGGGGGCALSPYSRCRPSDFVLPFIGYMLLLFAVTLLERRRHYK